jgi:hypothetical protein
MRLIGGIFLVTSLEGAASAQPAPKPPTAVELRAEIAQLESDIDPLVKPRLGDPASVRVDLSAAPIGRLFADINTKPPTQREVSFVMTNASGGIAHVESECKVWFVNIGSVGAWANFEDVNGGGIWLTLQNARANWNPGAGALDLGIDVGGYAFIPTVHTRIKPVCFLPAFGGPDIGPIGIRDIRVQSNSQVKLTTGSTQLFGVNAAMNVNASLQACTRIIFFDLCLPFDFAGHFPWTGDVGGPLQQDGQVVIPAGSASVSKKFTIDLTDRSASTTATGFRVIVAPVIIWR